jgi:tRNA(Ile)-lysidine synthetase-like protein
VQPLAAEHLPPDWRQNPDPWLAYVDGEALGEAELTTAFAGAVFAPLGLAGRHKLLGDLFTDRKIPPALRTGWPLIVDRARGRVLWVCGLQLAHEARITDVTRRIVRLAWQRAGAKGENG